MEDGTLIAENIVTKDLYIKTKLYEASIDQVEHLHDKVLDENRKLDQLQVPIQDEGKIWLARNLSEQELAKYEVQKNSMSNIQLEAKLRRYLPHKNLFSHVIGHLGLINMDERLSLPRAEYPDDSFIGKVGLEKSYEKTLRGKTGISLMEVDVYGNKIREINRVSPDKPFNLTLTLDLRLQKIAQEELANRRGAVVALDPKTGFIKALVSSPDYNPNILNGSESGYPVSESSMEDSPFFNRAIGPGAKLEIACPALSPSRSLQAFARPVLLSACPSGTQAPSSADTWPRHPLARSGYPRPRAPPRQGR